MKGFDWDGLTEVKKEAAEKEFRNYHLFYSIEELKIFLQNNLIYNL